MTSTVESLGIDWFLTCVDPRSMSCLSWGSGPDNRQPWFELSARAISRFCQTVGLTRVRWVKALAGRLQLVLQSPKFLDDWGGCSLDHSYGWEKSLVAGAQEPEVSGSPRPSPKTIAGPWDLSFLLTSGAQSGDVPTEDPVSFLIQEGFALKFERLRSWNILIEYFLSPELTLLSFACSEASCDFEQCQAFAATES